MKKFFSIIMLLTFVLSPAIALSDDVILIRLGKCDKKSFTEAKERDTVGKLHDFSVQCSLKYKPEGKNIYHCVIDNLDAEAAYDAFKDKHISN